MAYFTFMVCTQLLGLATFVREIARGNADAYVRYVGAPLALGAIAFLSLALIHVIGRPDYLIRIRHGRVRTREVVMMLSTFGFGFAIGSYVSRAIAAEPAPLSLLVGAAFLVSVTLLFLWRYPELPA